ncbi:hypothetical protein HN51_063444 [Arachis hypogaea]
MEMVMLEYMRRFQKEEGEAFEASKSGKHILDKFMVKKNFLTHIPNHQSEVVDMVVVDDASAMETRKKNHPKLLLTVRENPLVLTVKMVANVQL